MTVSDKINEWLSQSKKDLVANYDKMGLRNTGAWEKALESDLVVSGGNYKATILGASYTGALENGRKPNSNQANLKAWVGWAGSTFLKDWVKRKGLNISPFAIAWKIGREGITVPNRFNAGGLVSNVITKDSIEKLIKEVGMVMLGDLKSDVIKQFK
jgi:hypothetical protein